MIVVMNYDVIPDTSSYPRISGAADLNGGINSGAVDPLAYAEGSSGDDTDKKKNRAILFITIGVVVVMTVIAIGFFMYLNSQDTRASESVEFEPIEQTPPSARRPTREPEPTHVLPTMKPSPTPTPKAVTTFPTPTINRTNQNDRQLRLSQAPGPGRFSWEIIFPKTTYRALDFGDGRKVISATLYAPIEAGKMVCTAEDQMFFARKVSEKTLARLCDENNPTPVSRRLNCIKYDPDEGVPVQAELLPGDYCENPDTPVKMNQTYVMAVRVWFDCDGNQNASSVPESWCHDYRDVFSYDLYYSN